MSYNAAVLTGKRVQKYSLFNFTQNIMGTFLEVFPKFFVTDLKYRELQEQKRERNAGKGERGYTLLYIYI